MIRTIVLKFKHRPFHCLSCFFLQSTCSAWLNHFPQNNLSLWQGICECRVPLDWLLLTAHCKDGCQDVLVGLGWSGFLMTLFCMEGTDLSGSDDILRYYDYIWRRGWTNLDEKVLTSYSLVLSGACPSSFLDDASTFKLENLLQEPVYVAVGLHCSYNRWVD